MKKLALVVWVLLAGAVHAQEEETANPINAIDVPALVEKAALLPIKKCETVKSHLYRCVAYAEGVKAVFLQYPDGSIKYPKEKLRLCEKGACTEAFIDRPSHRLADLRKYRKH
jgi:hypothetical protein